MSGARVQFTPHQDPHIPNYRVADPDPGQAHLNPHIPNYRVADPDPGQALLDPHNMPKYFHTINKG